MKWYDRTCFQNKITFIICKVLAYFSLKIFLFLILSADREGTVYLVWCSIGILHSFSPKLVLVYFYRFYMLQNKFINHKNFLITPLVETIFYKTRYILSQFLLIAVITIWSVINDNPQDSIVTSKHHCKKGKIKKDKCLINYYANYVALYSLILSDDVKLNAGPDSLAKNNTLKCSICSKTVYMNR